MNLDERLPTSLQGEGSGRAPEALRWQGSGPRSERDRRPERVQWPHCLHPLTQPRPPPQLAHGRITPPSLWEPAGPAKRDLLRPQVLCLLATLGCPQVACI